MQVYVICVQAHDWIQTQVAAFKPNFSDHYTTDPNNPFKQSAEDIKINSLSENSRIILEGRVLHKGA